jgi:hypothetical protein
MATAAITFERETFAASVARRLEELNASQDFFVAYVSLSGRALSQPELSKIVNGIRTISSERQSQIKKALGELEGLSKSFAIPIRFDNADQIRDLVRACVHEPVKEVSSTLNQLIAGFLASTGEG